MSDLNNKHLPSDIDSLTRKDLVEIYHIHAEEMKAAQNSIAELEKEIFTQSQESKEAVERAIEIILEKDERIAELVKRTAKVELAFAILESHNLEQQRKGFWLGFEDARCHPDEMNILNQWENTRVFIEAKGGAE